MAISLQQAIDYSKANPQSDYAAKIGTAIKSGAFDQIAQQQGVDLSPYGRPKATTTQQPTPDQPTKTSPVATAASFAVDPVSAALKPAAEQVAPAVEKVGTDLTARGQNIVQAAQQSGQTALEAEKNLGDMGVPKPLATMGAVGLAGAKLGGQVAGQIAGGATDILGEGISAMAPQWLKDAVGRLGTQVAQLPQTQQAIKTATDAYSKIPDEVKPNVDALVNTLGLLGGGKAIEAAPGAIEKAAPIIKGAAKEVLPTMPEKAVGAGLEASKGAAWNDIKPNLTDKVIESYRSQGATVPRSGLKGVDIKPTQADQKVLDTISPLYQSGEITPKMSTEQKMSVLSDNATKYVKQADDIVAKNNKIVETPQLNSAFDAAKENNRVIFGTDKTLENAYDAVISAFKGNLKSGKAGATGTDLVSLRAGLKQFDATMDSKFPNIYKRDLSGDINPTDNARINAIRDVHTAVRDFIGKNLPEDSGYTDTLQHASNLIRAGEMVNKSADNLSKFESAVNAVRQHKLITAFAVYEIFKHTVPGGGMLPGF